MDAAIEQALKTDNLIDITTIGRKSGKAHRIEIVFHNFDNGLYITGRPGSRDWYANLLAHPEFTFHLKQSTQADLAARAIPITDEVTRAPILAKVVEKWNQQDRYEEYLHRSPLVRVELLAG